MRVTIISQDNSAYVGGIARTINMAGLSSDIHAVQWYDVIGEIEHAYDFGTNTQRPNVRFTDLSPYQVFIDRWVAAPVVTVPSTIIGAI